MPDQSPNPEQHLNKGHTRVPNVVADWVEPLLSGSEASCLRYIVRRTFGFADGEGGRKARDVIALAQFEKGVSVGPYVYDLGTGLSLGAIKKALEGLEEKQLVDVRYSCLNCDWEQQPGEPEPPQREGQAPCCPRCRKTLSRSWALVKLTPRSIIEFLNGHDKKGRKFEWDRDRKVPRIAETSEQKAKKARSEQDLRDEVLRIYRLLWYRRLVDQAVSMAEAQLPAGRHITLTRRMNNFYKPVWELQEQYNNPNLIRYALEATLNSDALKKPDTRGWVKYLATVAKNAQQRFSGAAGPAPGTNAEAARRGSPRAKELAMRELLAQAAELNDVDQEAARALLSDILSQVKDLAELFDGDERLCENSLREAYKQGSSDFISIRPNPQHYLVDHYAEWTWPMEERSVLDLG